MEKRKTLWILIGIGSFIFIVITLLSSVLETGERIRNIHVYLEYAFYVLSALLFYILIINPLRIILFSPSFSVSNGLNKDKHRNHKLYKKISRNLINSDTIEDHDKVALQSAKTTEELQTELTNVFNTSIKKEINKIIMNNAKTVLISTSFNKSASLYNS